MTYNNNTEEKLNGVEENKLKAKEWNCFEHIIWTNIIFFAGLHISALYGAYLLFTDTKLSTIIFAIFVFYTSLLGITGGCHRLWTHKSYKARLPFRIILGVFNSMAYQNSIYEWVRDHRVHHKYTETDADPHNSRRGFFFAHIGWLMCQKHPDVKRFGARIDLTDIMADPVVAIQKKFYIPSVILLCFVMPTVIPYYLWDESLWNGFFVAAMFRYVLGLNVTFLVNSAAHLWGYKPYDVNIAPVENYTVSALALGEGYHNYHHTFPWDYSTSEWGWSINITTLVLDTFAKIGWVYDRRYATKDMIESRKGRTGPLAHNYIPHQYDY